METLPITHEVQTPISEFITLTDLKEIFPPNQKVNGYVGSVDFSLSTFYVQTFRTSHIWSSQDMMSPTGTILSVQDYKKARPDPYGRRVTFFPDYDLSWENGEFLNLKNLQLLPTARKRKGLGENNSDEFVQICRSRNHLSAQERDWTKASSVIEVPPLNTSARSSIRRAERKDENRFRKWLYETQLKQGDPMQTSKSSVEEIRASLLGEDSAKIPPQCWDPYLGPPENCKGSSNPDWPCMETCPNSEKRRGNTGSTIARYKPQFGQSDSNLNTTWPFNEYLSLRDLLKVSSQIDRIVDFLKLRTEELAPLTRDGDDTDQEVARLTAALEQNIGQEKRDKVTADEDYPVETHADKPLSVSRETLYPLEEQPLEKTDIPEERESVKKGKNLKLLKINCTPSTELSHSKESQTEFPTYAEKVSVNPLDQELKARKDKAFKLYANLRKQHGDKISSANSITKAFPIMAYLNKRELMPKSYPENYQHHEEEWNTLIEALPIMEENCPNFIRITEPFTMNNLMRMRQSHTIYFKKIPMNYTDKMLRVVIYFILQTYMKYSIDTVTLFPEVSTVNGWYILAIQFSDSDERNSAMMEVYPYSPIFCSSMNPSWSIIPSPWKGSIESWRCYDVEHAVKIYVPGEQTTRSIIDLLGLREKVARIEVFEATRDTGMKPMFIYFNSKYHKDWFGTNIQYNSNLGEQSLTEFWKTHCQQTNTEAIANLAIENDVGVAQRGKSQSPAVLLVYWPEFRVDINAESLVTKLYHQFGKEIIEVKPSCSIFGRKALRINCTSIPGADKLFREFSQIAGKDSSSIKIEYFK